ncbi:hypothetical protein ANCCAN_21784 [Ancylostoma caninum]|uniref:Uncharacterized protein n=1 Tax=Ancylostoma caninum TaxID=29170 RepID=A0A368FQD0_ANCCA|nr:hypothetical protein ANCCAN_21784 [Ancylostoma caninum]
MSSGPTPPQLNQSPFGHFSYLFQQQHHPHSHHPHHQTPFTVQRQGGFKLKRQRQRVDAGEPRNSYQQQGKGFRDEMASDAMSALFPWMNQTTDLDFVKEEQPTDLSCKDNEVGGAYPSVGHISVGFIVNLIAFYSEKSG